MKEFIKIKNADGSGEMVLRVANILRVYDKAASERPAKAVVVFVLPFGECTYSIETALTAAEVLEAIEGQSEPKRILFSGGAGPYNYRMTVPSAHDADDEQEAPAKHLKIDNHLDICPCPACKAWRDYDATMRAQGLR